MTARNGRNRDGFEAYYNLGPRFLIDVDSWMGLSYPSRPCLDQIASG